MFEAVFTPDARTVYDALSDTDQAEVDAVIRLLEIDPQADDETTVSVTLGGIGFGVYDDGRWEIVFRVLDDRFIEVIGISRVSG